MKGVRVLLVLLLVIVYVYVWNATATWASPTPWRDSLLLLTDMLFKIVLYLVLISFIIFSYYFIGPDQADLIEQFTNLDTSYKVGVAILFSIILIRDFRKNKYI
jgi:hypothetical protein